MNFMNEAIQEAYKAIDNKNIPIGAVIVFNNEIIGRGHNERIISYDVTNHAEVIAIKEAANFLKDWRLDNCDLYVTLEPCNMCIEIIKASRIKNVFYLIPKLDYKKGYYKTNICSFKFDKKITEEYKGKLSDFFKVNCNR